MVLPQKFEISVSWFLLTSFCRSFLLLYDGSRSTSEDILDSCQKRLERLERLKRLNATVFWRGDERQQDRIGGVATAAQTIIGGSPSALRAYLSKTRS